MIEHVRKLAQNDVAQGKGSPDLWNAPSQLREANDAARAAAQEALNKK